MRKVVIFFWLIFIFNYGLCQSSSNLNITSNKVQAERNSTESFNINSLLTFGLNGLGNVNTETFTNLNAGGKLAGFIRR